MSTADSGRPLLLLALDAVPLHMMEELYDRGLLPGFRAPQPMVAPFPSLTQVSMSTYVRPVTGAVPLGYESTWVEGAERLVRGGLTDETAEATLAPWHGRPQGTLGHLAIYTLPDHVAWGQIRWITRAFVRQGGPWLAWITSTDAVAHFKGPEATLLAAADVVRQVTRARQEYAERRGVTPGVVLCSDHGMAFAKRLAHLDSLQVMLALRRAKRGAVLAPLGDVGFGAAWCDVEDAEAIATVVRGLPGVELAMARTERGARVLGEDGAADLLWDASTVSYHPDSGDPLQLAQVADELGAATPAAWLQASWNTPYPAAPPRIRAALTDLVQHPAQVLWSMADDATFGPPLTHLAARLAGGQVGTHGGLSRAQSLGFVCTTEPELPGGPLTPERVFEPWVDRLRAGAAAEE